MKVKTITILLLLFLSNNLVSQSWTKVQLVPPPICYLEAGVFFQDSGIIIGAPGYIIKSNDYFNTFVIDSVYDTAGLSAMSFPNRNTGYITLGRFDGLLKTLDGGNTWTHAPNTTLPIFTSYPDELLFISSDTGYAGASSSTGGNFYSTYNGGMNWNIPDSSYDDSASLYGRILRIHVMHDSIIYVLIITADDIILSLERSSDYGQTWSLISSIINPTQDPGDFYFLDDTTMILSFDRTILKSVNGGISFEQVMYNNNASDFYLNHIQPAIAFSGHDTGFVAFPSSIYKTYDAGDTWTSANFSFAPEDSNNTITFLIIACSQNAVVGCAAGDIYKMEPGCGVTGIQDIPDANSFTLYPNPASNKLYGTINNPQKSNLQILAIDGREVMPPLSIQQGHIEVDVSNLAAGLYFLVLQNEEEKVVRRFVKE